MSVTTTVDAEIDPAIQANEVLNAAVQSAMSFLQEGLEYIARDSETQTIDPKVQWLFDEEDERRSLRLVYREQAGANRMGYQVVLKRVPISQILDRVGRRVWMRRILEGVIGHRYQRVMDRFEQMIREQEEAEENAP